MYPRRNCNSHMVVILVFLVSQMLCKRISIVQEPTVKKNETDSELLIPFQISNYEDTIPQAQNALYVEYEKICLTKDVSYTIKIMIPKEYSSKEKFNLSIDSSPFFQHKSYDNPVSADEGEEFVFVGVLDPFSGQR